MEKQASIKSQIAARRYLKSQRIKKLKENFPGKDTLRSMSKASRKFGKYYVKKRDKIDSSADKAVDVVKDKISEAAKKTKNKASKKFGDYYSGIKKSVPEKMKKAYKDAKASPSNPFVAGNLKRAYGNTKDSIAHTIEYGVKPVYKKGAKALKFAVEAPVGLAILAARKPGKSSGKSATLNASKKIGKYIKENPKASVAATGVSVAGAGVATGNIKLPSNKKEKIDYI